jgi:hypothetical protein
VASRSIVVRTFIHLSSRIECSCKKRLTELEKLIRDSSSDVHHDEDYHEAKLLVYYLTNSHRLSTGALKAWQVLRRCGSIGSGDVRVAVVEDRCGSVEPMMCVFAERRYDPGDPVTAYNGRVVFLESPAEKNKPKKLKSHTRSIKDCGWGLDGLPFAEFMKQWAADSGQCDRQSTMFRLLTTTGVGYMCNSPSMNCSTTPANVTVKSIKTCVPVEGVLYKHVLVLVAHTVIEVGDEIICKYHESGAYNSEFHFDCLNLSHF